MVVSNLVAKSSAPTPAHVALAVVFQVRDAALQVLMWERAREPFRGSWALPGGALEADETLESSIRRHLAEKVDVRELAHLEQLETRSEPARNPRTWELATAYLGLVPAGQDPGLPTDTAWHRVASLPSAAFDHGEIVGTGLQRLRAKLSYTNIAFALAPPEFTLSELRTIYEAALGREVSATNLQRVLLRRGVLERTGSKREPGKTGGRPADVFRFRSQELEVTDPFAVLKPRE